MTAPAKELSADEIKQLKLEKDNRVRKNLRLLALCAAIYYFISAGFSWYEDYRDEKIRIIPQYRSGFVVDATTLETMAKKFNLDKFNLTFYSPVIQGNKRSYKLKTDSSNSGCFDVYITDDKVETMSLSFTGNSLKDEALNNALMFIVSLSENTTKSNILDEMMNVMEFDPNSEDPHIKSNEITSKKVRYTVEYKDNGIKTLVIKTSDLNAI